MSDGEPALCGKLDDANDARNDRSLNESSQKSATHRGGRYIIQDATDSVDFGLLPEGWIRLRHGSGLTIYFHRSTRVVTVSRPYSVGPGSVRHHQIPVSAIPCLAYKRVHNQEPGKTCIESSDRTKPEPIDPLPPSSVLASCEPGSGFHSPGLRGSSQPPVTTPCSFSTPDPGNRQLSDSDHYHPEVSVAASDREEGELSSGDDDEASAWSQSISKRTSELDTPSKKIRLEPPHEISNKSGGVIRCTSEDKSASIGISVITVKPHAISGKRRRRRRFPLGGTRGSAGQHSSEAASEENPSKQTVPAALPQTDNGVKEMSAVKTQVFAVKDKEMECLLTAEEIRSYCSLLFEIKVGDVDGRRNADKNEFASPEKESEEQPNRVLMMPEEAKVIRYQVSSVEGDPSRRQSKEGLINLTGKSYVCILHEYCQNVLRRPPTYQTAVLENDRNPYQLTVLIDGTPYATGVGQSKKQARLEAARNALSRLIPDFDKVVGSELQTSGPPAASERNIQLFDDISVTDPRMYELSVRMSLPTPYNLLVECLSRSCIPESDLKSNMSSQSRSKHFFSLELREHKVKVPCKNKREGRHLAAQHLLARLHPELTTWSGVLRMYGPGSKPDKRGELETIQGAQNQEKATVKTSLIRLLKAKMLELADQWVTQIELSQVRGFI
ncbi:unnamed protein product [Dicrocoelium dendriticum]|nr:unnamed protein product [Dicrocoelium dendriticum]